MSTSSKQLHPTPSSSARPSRRATTAGPASLAPPSTAGRTPRASLDAVARSTPRLHPSAAATPARLPTVTPRSTALLKTPATLQRLQRGGKPWRQSLMKGEVPQSDLARRREFVRGPAEEALVEMLQPAEDDQVGDGSGAWSLTAQQQTLYQAFAGPKAAFLSPAPFLDAATLPEAYDAERSDPTSPLNTLIRLSNLTTFLHMLLSSAPDPQTKARTRDSVSNLKQVADALLKSVLPEGEEVDDRVLGLLVDLKCQAFLAAASLSRSTVAPSDFFSLPLASHLPPSSAHPDRSSNLKFLHLQAAAVDLIERVGGDAAVLATKWKWDDCVAKAKGWVRDVAQGLSSHVGIEDEAMQQAQESEEGMPGMRHEEYEEEEEDDDEREERRLAKGKFPATGENSDSSASEDELIPGSSLEQEEEQYELPSGSSLEQEEEDELLSGSSLAESLEGAVSIPPRRRRGGNNQSQEEDTAEQAVRSANGEVDDEQPSSEGGEGEWVEGGAERAENEDDEGEETDEDEFARRLGVISPRKTSPSRSRKPSQSSSVSSRSPAPSSVSTRSPTPTLHPETVEFVSITQAPTRVDSLLELGLLQETAGAADMEEAEAEDELEDEGTMAIDEDGADRLTELFAMFPESEKDEQMDENDALAAEDDARSDRAESLVGLFAVAEDGETAPPTSLQQEEQAPPAIPHPEDEAEPVQNQNAPPTPFSKQQKPVPVVPVAARHEEEVETALAVATATGSAAPAPGRLRFGANNTLYRDTDMSKPVLRSMLDRQHDAVKIAFDSQSSQPGSPAPTQPVASTSSAKPKPKPELKAKVKATKGKGKSARRRPATESPPAPEVPRGVAGGDGDTIDGEQATDDLDARAANGGEGAGIADSNPPEVTTAETFELQEFEERDFGGGGDQEEEVLPVFDPDSIEGTLAALDAGDAASEGPRAGFNIEEEDDLPAPNQLGTGQPRRKGKRKGKEGKGRAVEPSPAPFLHPQPTSSTAAPPPDDDLEARALAFSSTAPHPSASASTAVRHPAPTPAMQPSASIPSSNAPPAPAQRHQASISRSTVPPAPAADVGDFESLSEADEAEAAASARRATNERLKKKKRKFAEDRAEVLGISSGGDSDSEIRIAPKRASGSRSRHKRTRRGGSYSDDSDAWLGSPRREEPVHRAGEGNIYHQDRNQPGGRIPWSRDEEALLIELIKAHGNDYKRMLMLHGPYGTVSKTFRNRNNMSIRDKAVNIKLKYLRAGQKPPNWLALVYVPESKYKSKQPTLPAANETDSDSEEESLSEEANSSRRD
ncbi:hypothetical protein JCM5296_002717 [Sporobolomyces johnsonii]